MDRLATKPHQDSRDCAPAGPGRASQHPSVLLLPLLLTLICLASSTTLQAEEADPELERVFSHLEFLEGAWTGNGFGGVTDEVWLPPSGGQMLGLFRLVGGTMPRFSEILTIGRFDGRIELRLKHFDGQLHGWEDKDDVVSFPFESSEPGKVTFRGLEFQKDGDDALRIELQLRNAERTWTEVFEFRRR